VGGANSGGGCGGGRHAEEVSLQGHRQGEPGYFTTIRAKFELPTGVTAPQSYVHHCHIVEHEDNDMMRPFEVLPS
jgi:spore coat protein A